MRLNAVAESGWVFSEWVGDINGNENPVDLTMDGPKNIKAVFKHYPDSGLPIIKLRTNQVVGPTMDKDSYVEGTVEIIGEGNFESLAETSMKIKGRGIQLGGYVLILMPELLLGSAPIKLNLEIKLKF